MQRMEGNVVATIREHSNRFGHVQIADSPGRNQPGTGELDYRFILDALDQSSYNGPIGLEYNPAESSEASLSWLPEGSRSGVRLDDLRL